MVLVKDVMTKTVLTVTPSDLLRDALLLMRTHHIRRIPIIDDGQLVGMISERELAGLASYTEWFGLGRDAYDEFLERSIGDAMSKRFQFDGGLIVATDEMPWEDAIQLIVDNKLSTLPVVSTNKPQQLVGILSYIDLLRHTHDMLTKS